MKTKSLLNIEEKMQEMDEDSLRYHILENAKKFKTSWIELGRGLYTVSKDKLYKDWGYSSFEIYTAREIGIRKQTAMKLLRSYYFLEKEEPDYLKKGIDSSETAMIPSYESIDVLRQVKNKKAIDGAEYEALKKEVFDKGRDVREVKKSVSALMMRQREELDPEEAREKKKTATVKRFLGVLKSLKQEIEVLKLLPAKFIKDAEELINKLEAEIK